MAAQLASVVASLIALARTPGPQKYVCRTNSISPVHKDIGPQVTYSDLGLELGVGAGEVLAGLNGLAHATEDVLPVRAAEHGTRAEEGQRVVFSAGIVDGNVPEHVLADLLRQVDVDAQEVG